MQLIRGTTPTIIINVTSDIDLTNITQVWVYISQRGAVVIDKDISNVQIDTEHKQISVILTQEETLALKAEDALFQIRVLLSDDTALATIASEVNVIEVYKGGVIE